MIKNVALIMLCILFLSFQAVEAEESTVNFNQTNNKTPTEMAILADLKQARLSGNTELSVALQAELDKLNGLTLQPKLNSIGRGLDRVRRGSSSPQKSGPDWHGDVWVTRDPAVAQGKPSMTQAPNGDLWLAAERLSSSEEWIDVYKSTDGGLTWHNMIGFATGLDSHNPSIAYADGDENWIHVVYEAEISSSGFRDIKLFSCDPSDPYGLYKFDTVVPNVLMGSFHIYPEICTDNNPYSNYYIYVTYSADAIDYRPTFITRSTDFGDNWSTPVNITGGSENFSWEVKPDNAFGYGGGHNNLVIAFVKYDGYLQIWQVRSTNYGTSWGAPVQLTTAARNHYNPSVAAAKNDNTAVVLGVSAYPSETDICGVNSNDGGASWTSQYSLPWTLDNEHSVDLCASLGSGRYHAAFWRSYDICYTWTHTSAPAQT